MAQLVFWSSVAIVVSAMCSLFEATILSLPVSRVETLAQTGRSSGRILRNLRQNIDRPLSAILSLNTVANTGGAAMAGAAAVSVFGRGSLVADVYFPVFFTLFILFFSEVIPKTAGAVYNRSLASVIARPVQILVWTFTPAIWLCHAATWAISRNRQEQSVSPEELIVLARAGQRIGAIEADEASVIQNILSLKTKTAREVMTPRTVVFSLFDDLTVAEAHTQAGIWAHSRVPVYDKDYEDIVGIVLRRDVLTALAEDRGEVRLSDLMRPVHFVAESTTLDRILKMFLESRQHLFVVIDEYGGLAGVLSLEDIQEEILGKQIVDELDEVTDMRELARHRRQQALEDREKRQK